MLYYVNANVMLMLRGGGIGKEISRENIGVTEE